jgi:hypothetical protein
MVFPVTDAKLQFFTRCHPLLWLTWRTRLTCVASHRGCYKTLDTRWSVALTSVEPQKAHMWGGFTEGKWKPISLATVKGTHGSTSASLRNIQFCYWLELYETRGKCVSVTCTKILSDDPSFNPLNHDKKGKKYKVIRDTRVKRPKLNVPTQGPLVFLIRVSCREKKQLRNVKCCGQTIVPTV